MKKLHAQTEKEANKKAVMNPLLTFVFFFEEGENIDLESSQIQRESFSIFDKNNFWKEPFIDIPNPPPIYKV